MTKTATKPAAPELFPGDQGEQTVLPPEKQAVAAEPKPARKAGVVQKLPAVQTAPEPKNMLAIIAAAAADPRVDVQKMQQLLTMQQDIDRAHEAREFNNALHAAQSEMPKIIKDKKTDKAPYASLENVSKNVDPIARKHGFSMSGGTEDSPLKDHYRIVCDLSHNAGHVRRYFVDLPADSAGAKGTQNKSAVQAIGATISFGRRYIKVLMFDLVIVGEDTDGGNRSPVTKHGGDGDVLIGKDQLKALAGAIAWCGVNERQVCQTYGIEKIPDLPASQFENAMTACRNYAANNPTKTKGKIDG